MELALQAFVLVGGIGSITPGRLAISRGTSAILCGVDTDPLELLGQRSIRGRDHALDRLCPEIPAPGHLVARGGGDVALGGCCAPESSSPRSPGAGGKAPDLAGRACGAGGIVGLKRRPFDIDRPLMVRDRLVLISGTLIARGVGLVSFDRGLVGV
jgi:hypothetical protein